MCIPGLSAIAPIWKARPQQIQPDRVFADAGLGHNEGTRNSVLRPNTKALSGCQGDRWVVSKQGGGVQGEPVLPPAGDERLTYNI